MIYMYMMQFFELCADAMRCFTQCMRYVMDFALYTQRYTLCSEEILLIARIILMIKMISHSHKQNGFINGVPEWDNNVCFEQVKLCNVYQTVKTFRLYCSQS